MFTHVIIKISGEALKGKTKHYFNDDTLEKLINQMTVLKEKNILFSLVFGGGNIWRGHENDNIPPGASHEIGMLASTMNGLYMAQQLQTRGLSAKVLTPFIIGGMTEMYNRDRTLDYLKRGIIPIFSAGTGLPFFSTDTICAVRAADLGCDGVVFTKEYKQTDETGRLYSGLYTADPIIDPTATKIDTITYADILTQKLQAIDEAASAILQKEGIKSTIINVEVDNALVLSTNPTDPAFMKKGTFIK